MATCGVVVSSCWPPRLIPSTNPSLVPGGAPWTSHATHCGSLCVCHILLAAPPSWLTLFWCWSRPVARATPPHILGGWWNAAAHTQMISSCQNKSLRCCWWLMDLSVCVCVSNRGSFFTVSNFWGPSNTKFRHSARFLPYNNLSGLYWLVLQEFSELRIRAD